MNIITSVNVGQIIDLSTLAFCI